MTNHACLFLLALAFGLTGCERTQEAIKQDTADATEAVLTPQIKAAIVANPILNDPKNLIDVETDGGAVYLRGHVGTEESKLEAQQIAQRVIDEGGSNYQLINELEVRPEPTKGG
jgi:osmotically-inducible protein OsmY